MTEGLGSSVDWSGGTADGAGPRYWGVAIQTVDLSKLDPYLESVSDQEGALTEALGFTGRLVLRSQRRSDRFWLIDGWSDQRSLETAAITLRTLSSVAGLVEEPRVIGAREVAVGGPANPPLTPVAAREPGQLPFYMIAENWIKRVSMDQYMEMQERFTIDLQAEPGYGRRMLLQDLSEETHYLVLDQWESEQLAFEAFERRQETFSQTEMQRFMGLMSKRGEPDFALGIHG
ncbi:MAG: antibiotic biosynthesis monooxygenase [Candidatus Dormibacteria bacterium]